MAKKRRSYQVNSTDYNVAGGGGGTSGGNVRMMQKSNTAVAAGGTGILYTPGTKQVPNPLKFNCEAGLAFPTASSTDSTVYFEHAFEAPNAQVALVGSNQTDELPTGYSGDQPAGMTFSTSQDTGDGGFGYVQISTATLSSGGATGIYKFRYSVDQGGWSRSYIDYEINVWPANTTPTQANSSILASTIIQNTASPQYLTDTITGSQIQGYTLKDVSGFTTGVTPKVDATNGKVYVENVGATGTIGATTHAFTVEVDIGEYGKIDYAYSGSVGYGDPYGSVYYGPANARTYFSNNAGPYDEAQTQQSYNNLNKTSGALKRYYNHYSDTSPYSLNDGYGCEFYEQMFSIYNNGNYANDGNKGWMGPLGDAYDWWNAAANYKTIRYRWNVPNGVNSVCMVAVGGGAGGAYQWSSDGAGGGGLAWMNGVSVVPGETLEIGVGLGRYSESNVGSYGAGNSWVARHSTNASVRAGQTIIFAGGGGYQAYNGNSPNGQTYNSWTISGLTQYNRNNTYNFGDSRDGGGWYINATEGVGVNGWHYGGGIGSRDTGNRIGGGAGGYRGDHNNFGSDQPGYGGGGGSGFYYSSTYGQGGGGGTGLDGQGSDGKQGGGSIPRTDAQAGSGLGGSQGAWTSYNNGSANYLGAGGGGSGGSRGNYGQSQYANYEVNGNRTRNGGLHGGAGGGSGTSQGGGNGAAGGVRIIWGVGADGTARSFPYTYCSEKPTMKYNGE